MKRQGGFTLIEMIVVIVILGILAVTAAPKFLNFQDDARVASLNGLKGAIQSAASMTYGKAALEGKETGAKELTGGLQVNEGYPKGTELSKIVDGLATGSTDWKVVEAATASVAKYTWFFDDASTAPNCYVQYTAATASSEAITTVVIGSDCGGS
ncbi:type II secretion system protein [Enterovibrio norvegicus]|uniref:type II secretion system protein n=1 Tax=Enterovibrio norvegicus TaxID=188144 RepID=UPI000C815DB2|nr:type II secretion system protein [Enterovibrio norvegicus]PML78480.1 MSHA biogenesis protein MshA [Enterovibrio norvegicus]